MLKLVLFLFSKKISIYINYYNHINFNVTVVNYHSFFHKKNHLQNKKTIHLWFKYLSVNIVNKFIMLCLFVGCNFLLNLFIVEKYYF
jgi:hypothetical protein